MKRSPGKYAQSSSVKISEIFDPITGYTGFEEGLMALHDGSPEEVREEALRQCRCSKGRFIAANGSPITPGTPQENVHVLIDTIKEAGYR